MSTNKTTNYNLHAWVKTDPVSMDEFNENFSKIDTALGGMVKIASGSYIGTGTYGANNPITLTFDFAPKLVLIAQKKAERPNAYTIAMYGQEQFIHLEAQSHLGNFSSCTWTENALSWYSTYDAMAQINEKNVEYRYIALG